MVWPMPHLSDIRPDIVGGEDAKQGEFPHQVSMQISFLWIIEQHICGATIISESWVLTAAHCIKGTPWYTSNFILAGKTNLGRKEDGQQRRKVKKRFVHEEYQWNQNNGVGPFDIGLLLLDKPLEFSDTIKPAKLPVWGAIPTGEATLSGWGSTSNTMTQVMPNALQKVTLPIIPFENCYNFIQSASQGEENPLRDTNVCVGYLEVAGQGACSEYQWNQNNGVGPYDIGLLLLDKPLDFTDTIRPARLPLNDAIHAIPKGEAILSGWGSTSNTMTQVMPNALQKVTLPIIPFDECYKFIESASQGEENPLRDTNVCVGYLEVAGQGACSGDSGGPLIQMTDDGQHFVVIGATSWGFFPCQDKPAPSVYTRVSAYTDWIYAQMSKNK
ncbi:Trypsin-1 [Frankliniella fusca]|uniref:Trypsin-1 n=1 Tax=Frankliniella fusca TaxID=407009 RepID=A0AAE1HQD8_9NEOP|nr:Trypsin-1 [Frankliniella fusca]